ncbi:MAG TPA: DUF6266 family protein [Pedobacter sp.]|uniref:DUF6266 family protein n=1 Tax=Pedobacter sp. TaxID=1411316 RepID=UPI002CED5F43|nr:DUF6266 family protein [Pedobacter sp.]HMI03891.1 DUF6266 family protein [Pedobacter sp.]
MAKINSGIFGPVSGKIGPVIGSSWMGIPYLKAVSRKSSKKKPRSPAQMANEAKFKFANNWLVPFHPYLTVGFQNLAIKKTAISAGFSANYRTVFIGIYPDIEIIYDKLIISSGPLTPLGNPQAVFSSSDTIELTWEQNYRPGVVYNDQVMLVLYSEAHDMTDGFIGAVSRATQQYSFKISPKLTGEALHAYISVTSLDRKQIADSIYIGKIDPL